MYCSKWRIPAIFLVALVLLASSFGCLALEEAGSRSIEQEINQETNGAFVWKDDTEKKYGTQTEDEDEDWKLKDDSVERNSTALNAPDGSNRGDRPLQNEVNDFDFQNTPSLAIHSQEGALADPDADEEMGNWVQDEVIVEQELEDDKKDNADGQENVEEVDKLHNEDPFGDFAEGTFGPNSAGLEGANLYGERDMYYGEFDDMMFPSSDGWDMVGDDAEKEEEKVDDAAGDEESHMPRVTQTRNEVDRQYEGRNKLQDLLNFNRFRKFEPKVESTDGPTSTSNKDHVDEIRAALREQIFGRLKGGKRNVIQDNINSLNQDGIDGDTMGIHNSARRALIHELVSSYVGIALLIGTTVVILGTIMYLVNRRPAHILPVHV